MNNNGKRPCLKKEPRPKKRGGLARGCSEERIFEPRLKPMLRSLWREMQQSLMMSLEPWLKIQADLARHVEIAVQMAQLASQSEQYLKAGERKEELHSAIARWEAIANSIKLPEIPPATPAINALRKADVNVEELVSVIQKQKDQLQLKEDEILRLKKLMAEIREKKREYIG
jgi:hypothetical protein